MEKQKTTDGYIFLAIPFGSTSVELREAVKIACERAGFRLMCADQAFAPKELISGAIRDVIKEAVLIIGEMSDSNPNVTWELGFAQAMNKPILLLTRDPGTIPFDLCDVRAITYQLGSMIGLISRLEDAILASVPGLLDPDVAKRKVHRDQVFFSYSHSDSEYLNRMLIHLRPVERSGAINQWSDTKITPGDRWREEIRKAVKRARIAVLLISADFLASEFIATDELPPLLSAAEADGARIIPVILKPSRFLRDDKLARFQALNDPKSPVIKMAEADREGLYAKLAEIIETEIDLPK